VREEPGHHVFLRLGMTCQFKRSISPPSLSFQIFWGTWRGGRAFWEEFGNDGGSLDRSI
jgi:hypothetical protein